MLPVFDRRVRHILDKAQRMSAASYDDADPCQEEDVSEDCDSGECEEDDEDDLSDPDDDMVVSDVDDDDDDVDESAEEDDAPEAGSDDEEGDDAEGVSGASDVDDDKGASAEMLRRLDTAKSYINANKRDKASKALSVFSKTFGDFARRFPAGAEGAEPPICNLSRTRRMLAPEKVQPKSYGKCIVSGKDANAKVKLVFDPETKHGMTVGILDKEEVIDVLKSMYHLAACSRPGFPELLLADSATHVVWFNNCKKVIGDYLERRERRAQKKAAEKA